MIRGPWPKRVLMKCRTCGTCRYWKRFNVHSDLGDCDLFETTGGDKKHAKAQLMSTRTGECTIVTEERFGCRQWEEPDP